MKKIIICLIGAIILSNCEVKVKEAKAEAINLSCNEDGCATMDRKTIDGMEYLIFGSTHPYSNSPYIINLTKEKLEVELLKKQLYDK